MSLTKEDLQAIEAALDRKLEPVISRLDSVESKLGSLESRIYSTEKRINSIELSIVSLKTEMVTRLTIIETDIKDLKIKFADQVEDVNGIDKDIKDIRQVPLSVLKNNMKI